MTTTLEPGDLAPSFVLPDQHGTAVRLKDFRGRKLRVDVAGISPDEPADPLAFDSKWSLGFPLLSDTDHVVAEARGTWGERKLYGAREALVKLNAA